MDQRDLWSPLMARLHHLHPWHLPRLTPDELLAVLEDVQQYRQSGASQDH